LAVSKKVTTRDKISARLTAGRRPQTPVLTFTRSRRANGDSSGRRTKHSPTAVMQRNRARTLRGHWVEHCEVTGSGSGRRTKHSPTAVMQRNSDRSVLKTSVWSTDGGTSSSSSTSSGFTRRPRSARPSDLAMLDQVTSQCSTQRPRSARPSDLAVLDPATSQCSTQ